MFRRHYALKKSRHPRAEELAKKALEILVNAQI